MKLTRPICFLDIEATGTKPQSDKIVTLDITKLLVEGAPISLTWNFNPGFEMCPEVIAIHGITNEMAATYETLNAVHANEIITMIAGCDLGGFNLRNFDIPILWEELYRVGKILDLAGVHVIDAGNIFKLKERRDLASAMKFYCGREHNEAHNSAGDVAATIDVLEGQLKRYPELAELDVPALAKFSQMDDRVDLAGIIVRNKDGVPVFNTNRNKGVPVKDDIGYAEWFLRSDFPTQTKMVIRGLIEEIMDDGTESLF